METNGPGKVERRTNAPWRTVQRAHLLLEIMSAGAALALVIFFAFGFQFRTPASWLTELSRADTIEMQIRSSDVRRLDARIDTIRSAGVMRDEKLDFLIRLGCGQVQTAALVRACDNAPAPNIQRKRP
jgi:hypothetical protein